MHTATTRVINNEAAASADANFAYAAVMNALANNVSTLEIVTEPGTGVYASIEEAVKASGFKSRAIGPRSFEGREEFMELCSIFPQVNLEKTVFTVASMPALSQESRDFMMSKFAESNTPLTVTVTHK